MIHAMDQLHWINSDCTAPISLLHLFLQGSKSVTDRSDQKDRIWESTSIGMFEKSLTWKNLEIMATSEQTNYILCPLEFSIPGFITSWSLPTTTMVYPAGASSLLEGYMPRNWAFFQQWTWKANTWDTQTLSWIRYPAGNQHIPYQGTFEDDVPFPKVGYVSYLEGRCFTYYHHCWRASSDTVTSSQHHSPVQGPRTTPAATAAAAEALATFAWIFWLDFC